MSFRVEHADPLELMYELPSGWAQTCITTAPEGDPDAALEVLAQVKRVLREDGTLWLGGRPSVSLLAELSKLGWLLQPLPRWATQLEGAVLPRALLFTKSERYFCRPVLARAETRRRSASQRSVGLSGRCDQCRARRTELLERVILGCSTMRACGACGAPRGSRRHGELITGHGGCAHLSASGRCLVLDPFYEPSAGTAQLAHRHGRAFLGIARNAGIRVNL